MKKTSKTDIIHIAKLANLNIAEIESVKLQKQFKETLREVDKLKKLNTMTVAGTYHVTGVNNVLRSDVIDKERVLSQDAALSNANRVFNGYFVVPAIFNEK